MVKVHVTRTRDNVVLISTHSSLIKSIRLNHFVIFFIIIHLRHPTWVFHSSLIVQSYARQLNILTNRTTALESVLDFDTQSLIDSSMIGRLKI